ncbi:MAG TPA: hypothetical protein VEW92_00130 [Nitrososphaeraceae archaeon]|nr:hypothetical protein [Nitrososphaeraceae archaeon]
MVPARKGRLDARVYLANNTKDVVNLILIGIPNTGSSIAQSSEFCTPPHFFRY